MIAPIYSFKGNFLISYILNRSKPCSVCPSSNNIRKNTISISPSKLRILSCNIPTDSSSFKRNKKYNSSATTPSNMKSMFVSGWVNICVV